MNGKAVLADGESLSVLRWVPDYYVQDNEVYKKSDDAENPAVQLGLTNAKGETKKLWILYSQVEQHQRTGCAVMSLRSRAQPGRSTRAWRFRTSPVSLESGLALC